MPECSWNNCSEEAITDVSLDYGDEVCQTCGNTKTNKMVFLMCEDHQGEFTNGNNENTILVINATGALL